jgi:hypothetical protein
VTEAVDSAFDNFAAAEHDNFSLCRPLVREVGAGVTKELRLL